MVFLLHTELMFNKAEIVEKSVFESLIIVNLLKEVSKNSVIYDKELKMHFENPSALAKIHEVELHKIFVDLTPRLSPANDFARRLMYRYDWIQPKVNAKGRITSIENTDEMKSAWKKIKKALQEDYKGRTVEKYINKTEQELETQDFLINPMSQYFYFGLIFPCILPEHGKDWTNKRIVRLSDYDKEQFEEYITFDRKFENLRLYNIGGKTLSGSDSEIKEYSGLVRMKDYELFPSQTDILVSYRKNNSTNLCQWKFRLEQY